jgi:hypothetical protein
MENSVSYINEIDNEYIYEVVRQYINVKTVEDEFYLSRSNNGEWCIYNKDKPIFISNNINYAILYFSSLESIVTKNIDTRKKIYEEDNRVTVNAHSPKYSRWSSNIVVK